MNTVTTMNTAVKTASVSLVVDNTKPLTMSSRQIAEFTGKEHHKVKVDITKMLNALGYEDHAKFRVIYFDQYGREQNEYQLDEEMTLTLVTGYDVKRRMVVIQEWKRLKEENEKLRSQQVNPYANMTKLDWIREAMELEAANEQLIQEKEQLVDLHIRKAIDAHSLSRLLGEKRGSTKVQMILKGLCAAGVLERRLDASGNAKVVGNSRFDTWHNDTFDRTIPDNIKLDERKPMLLYAPTFGALSSLPHWAEKLGRLNSDVNLICKLHHGTCSRPEEAASLALARRHLKQRIDSAHHTQALLAKADYVLTDNSGFIFDAIHVDKRVILLDFPGMAELLDGEKSYSTPESADQRIREILPVAHDMAELRYLLSEAFDWGAVQARLTEIRHHYCDAFMDGKAGERAAMVIVEALG